MYRLAQTFMFLAAAALLAPQLGFPQEAKQKAPPSKAKVLTRQEVDNLLAAPDKVLFLDVRRPDEVSSSGGFPVYRDRDCFESRRSSRPRRGSARQQGIQSDWRCRGGDLRVGRRKDRQDRGAEADIGE